jgi:hypothetical protein
MGNQGLRLRDQGLGFFSSLAPESLAPCFY